MAMKRVFVLGVDGLCLPIWEQITGEQSIPYLSRLFSTVLPVHSTTPAHSAPAWTSISTGLNPGRHGVLDFWRRIPNIPTPIKSRPLVTNSGKLSFWEVAHQQGHKVGVFNYPLSYPPREVNGFWISGLNTPPNAKDFVWPSNLRGDLVDFVADVDILDAFQRTKPLTDDQRIDTLDSITSVLQNHIQTGLKAISGRVGAGVSLHVFVITATDRFLHLFWDTLFKTDRAPSARLKKGVVTFWRALDEGVRQWLEAAQPDLVILTSDHGFCQYPAFAFNCSKWLEDSGFIPKRTERLNVNGLIGVLSRSTRLKAALQQVLPMVAVRDFRERLRDDSLRSYSAASPLIPEVLYGPTLAFTLNVIGRQPSGALTPASAERLQAEVIARAKALADERGQAVFRSVEPNSGTWWGEYLATFPDITANLQDQFGAAVGSLDPRLFIPITSVRTGDHHHIGMVGFSEPYTSDIAGLTPISVWDVPAIALHLLEAAVPQHFDGRVPEWLPGTPNYTDEYVNGDPGTHQYSPEDAEAITNRLRGLGYVD
jgi:predicted AlkP superfamily phosphohydrolase/phosphomutase